MRFLKAFGAFWYDFVIGDDWKIAAFTVIALGVVAVVVASDLLPDGIVAVIGTVLLSAFFVAGVRYDTRKLR
jgi:hypothetical protein